MRIFALYLRSHDVPAGLLCGVLAMIVVAQLGTGYTDPQRAVIAAALALALGLAVLGHGLDGPDNALDMTAAIRWAPRRTLHLGAITIVAATVVTAVTSAPTGIVLRDAAGFAGLTTLAAALFGRRLTWTLPIAAGCLAAVIPAMPEPLALHLLTWATQPSNNTTAATIATVYTVTGTATYLIRRSRTAS
jgi:hypothetical protein